MPPAVDHTEEPTVRLAVLERDVEHHSARLDDVSEEVSELRTLVADVAKGLSDVAKGVADYQRSARFWSKVLSASLSALVASAAAALVTMLTR